MTKAEREQQERSALDAATLEFVRGAGQSVSADLVQRRTPAVSLMKVARSLARHAEAGRVTRRGDGGSWVYEAVPMSTMELAWLAWRYRKQGPGVCRVCGGELKCGAMGGGRATFNCGSDEADTMRHPWGSEEYKAASTHRQSSEVVMSQFGDTDVRRLVYETRLARRRAGQPMFPEDGASYYPWGDSGGRYVFGMGDVFEGPIYEEQEG